MSPHSIIRLFTTVLKAFSHFRVLMDTLSRRVKRAINSIFPKKHDGQCGLRILIKTLKSCYVRVCRDIHRKYEHPFAFCFPTSFVVSPKVAAVLPVRRRLVKCVFSLYCKPEEIELSERVRREQFTYFDTFLRKTPNVYFARRTKTASSLHRVTMITNCI